MLNRKTLIVIISLCIVGVLLPYIGYRLWQWKGVSSVTHGKKVAQKMGCFACHGPGGIRGILNPRSDEKTVPSWDGGTVMMYVQNEQEIREWIVDGVPKRLKQEHADHHHGDNEDHEDQKDKPLISMPAYRGKLSERELNDLVAYFKAVSWYHNPDDSQVLLGRQVAQQYGCFGCHGPEGRGNISNPGSLKGYIPPWDGPDFPKLVKDENELQEWILDGSIGRFRENPIANQFLKRQQIKMPGYRNILTGEEIKQLVAYIQLLRRENDKTEDSEK